MLEVQRCVEVGCLVSGYGGKGERKGEVDFSFDPVFIIKTLGWFGWTWALVDLGLGKGCGLDCILDWFWLWFIKLQRVRLVLGLQQGPIL